MGPNNDAQVKNNMQGLHQKLPHVNSEDSAIFKNITTQDLTPCIHATSLYTLAH